MGRPPVAFACSALLAWTTMLLGAALAQEGSSQSRPLNDGSFKFGAKTSFSCTGRAAGYYADVETGCQIYHMCDGLGRQFSYACPNTTLFQQRMLICDHWYMVNCSKAESNYAANLLIGQRDKPFVPEEENEIRTPRPDLLDRPEGFAFGAPSLKNFFKSNAPPVQNAIVDSQARSRPSPIDTAGKGSHQQSARKTGTTAEIFQESASNHGLPIHWSTRYAKEDTNNATEPDNSSAGKTKRNEDQRQTAASQESPTPGSVPVPAKPPVPGVKVPSRRYEPPFTPAEYERRSSGQQSPTGSTPRVSSSPTTTAQPRFSNTPKLNTTTATTTTTVPPTTTRSASTTSVSGTKQQQQPTPQQLPPRTQPAQFKPPTPPKAQPPQPRIVTNPTKSTEADPLADPRLSILPPKEILFKAPAATAGLFDGSRPGAQLPPAGVSVPSRDLLPPYENLANFDQIKTRYTSESIYTRQPITNEPSAGPLRAPIDKLAESSAPLLPARPPSPSAQDDKVPRPFSVPRPANDLLPPNREYVFYDDATTQGPPIYYQWKWSVPSFGLEPPGLEAPAPPAAGNGGSGAPAAAGNEPPSTQASGVRKLEDEETQEVTPLFGQLHPIAHVPEVHDGGHRGRQHNQTARSISSETGNLGENRVEVEAKHVVRLPQHNYLQLRQQFAIPDFTFPLDGAAKEGQYGDAEAVDSFQVRIPSDGSARTWYGENSRCPDCHPGFLRPGSCEPCVKVRR